MGIYTLRRSQIVPRGIEETFAFFADAKNLAAITPPWLKFEMVETPPSMQAGTRIRYRLKWKGIALGWLTEIRIWEPPRRFMDVQLRGPYRLWEHEHCFEPVPGGTCVRDEVRYALPLGMLGRLAHRCGVRRDLERIFDYRASRLEVLLGSDRLLAGQHTAGE